MKSDIVIAQEAKMEPIMNIAKKLGVEEISQEWEKIIRVV